MKQEEQRSSAQISGKGFGWGLLYVDPLCFFVTSVVDLGPDLLRSLNPKSLLFAQTQIAFLVPGF